MNKYSERAGVRQLQQLFPSPPWRVEGLGGDAGELSLGAFEYVGLLSVDRSTRKWACTHNMIPRQGDPHYAYSTPLEAAWHYYVVAGAHFAQVAVISELTRMREEAKEK